MSPRPALQLVRQAQSPVYSSPCPFVPLSPPTPLPRITRTYYLLQAVCMPIAANSQVSSQEKLKKENTTEEKKVLQCM